MPEELIIEVDENDKKIGLRPRSDFYTGKYIHRTSHLLLINSKNELLIQKRAKNKKWYPDVFTYSVSATVANESYTECIKREMEEELGISVPCDFLYTYRSFSDIDKAFRAVFLAKEDIEVRPDKEEIQFVKWISIDELKKDIGKNPKEYSAPFLKGVKIFLDGYYGNKS